MDAKELRIGNFVNYEQTTHQIVGVELNYIKSVWSNTIEGRKIYKHATSTIKPIPLTKEILIKSGANKVGKIDCYDFEYLRQTLRIYLNGEVWFEEDVACDFVELNTYNKMKYVHELQNLYFALTGKELEIKF